MHLSKVSLLALSATSGASAASPTPIPSANNLTKKAPARRNAPALAHTKHSKRGEPDTGADLPDVTPHPNELDKVETAFKDAIELTSYVIRFIDTDHDIFPLYFAEETELRLNKSSLSCTTTITGTTT
ncbi:hypothetical protein K458DRAFT_399136 [Lentithecium fluviatile CBS 122367]|uniref:Uncharacterized protein n=1 Tax=Lentithecium fluviatile CBS 122367 TaxID=1168545 RepID=A0A6G1JL73_9PLEO|nr:hypothetical protein K458DRAFT_399136 [Lentithecium fluviatile CBS 122367]